MSQVDKDVHHDAVVARGVLREGGLEFGGHEPRIAGRVEQVIDAGAQLFTRGVFEHEAAPHAAAEREHVWLSEPLGESAVACDTPEPKGDGCDGRRT